MTDVLPAQSIDASTVKTEVNSTLQAFVDQEESKQADLYRQRDALKQQILSLNQQLNALNKQIAAGESDELRKTRAKLQAIEMIESGRGGPGLRGLGL